MEEFYRYEHKNFNITTLGDFLNRAGSGLSIAQSYVNSPSEFLNIKGNTALTNRSRLLSSYTAKEASEAAGKPDKDLLLKVGTVFYIPFNKLNRDSATGTIPDLISLENIGAYIAPKLESLINNSSYSARFLNKRGSYRTEFNDLSVQIWSRTLSEEQDGELQGDFLNISSFVEKLDTNVQKENGGKFTLNVTPILAKKNGNKWNIDKDTVRNYLRADSNNLSFSQMRKTSTVTIDERENFFFHNVIQPNDLIFIAFEELKSDNRSNSFTSSSGQMARGNYDMIGMIDSVNTVINSETNDVTIQIQGRDLIKTIIEDGTYFFPEAFGMDTIFNRKGGQEKLIERVFGELTTLAAYSYRTIQFSVGFVINQLQNTGYVPDGVFSGWGDERNTSLKSNRAAIEKQRLINKDFKETNYVIISESRKESELSLKNPDEERKEAEKVFNTITGLISSGDLVQDSNPNFLTQQAINQLDGLLYDRSKININSLTELSSPSLAISSVISFNKNKDRGIPEVRQDLANGLWQIIDITVDRTIQDRLIVDSSISTASGSLINFIKKICQEPFIEFFTDTYENKFSFNIRKSPYDKKGYQQLVEDTINIKNKTGVISSGDVYSESLDFDDELVYTWYVMRPKGHLMGFDQFSLAYLPAIYIEDYVEIWGSRPLDITNNYVPLIPNESEKKVSNQFNFDKSAFAELKFLIDINSYMPFVRSGSITIRGDRRFKVGCACYNESTDEYFIITGVTQSYIRNNSVNERVTILEVERGMKRRYFKAGNNSNGYSYFNIVDTTLNEKVIKKQNSKGEVVFNRDFAKSWGVNDKNQFNFFLKRLQFD